MSSYELITEKVLKKKGISYNKQVPEIPWRQYRTDFTIWICFIKFLLEIDWEHHAIPRQWLSDRKKDIYSRLYGYRVVRIRADKNLTQKLERTIIKMYIYSFFIWIFRILTTALLYQWVYDNYILLYNLLLQINK